MLQAVLFDLWETLITDPMERSVQRVAWRAENVSRVLEGHGIVLDVARVSSALSESSVTLTSYHDDGRDDGPAGRVDLFLNHLECAEAFALDVDARRELEDAITSLISDHAPLRMPDAVETLEAVRAMGLKTGLVSNAGLTTAPALRDLLSLHGLLPHLDSLVFSDELALAKPHERLFGTALEFLGVDAAATVFVGDSPHNDVFGARSCGMHTVLIGERHVDGIVPDARIAGLVELLPALQGLGLLSDTATTTA